MATGCRLRSSLSTTLSWGLNTAAAAGRLHSRTCVAVTVFGMQVRAETFRRVGRKFPRFERTAVCGLRLNTLAPKEQLMFLSLTVVATST